MATEDVLTLLLNNQQKMMAMQNVLLFEMAVLQGAVSGRKPMEHVAEMHEAYEQELAKLQMSFLEEEARLFDMRKNSGSGEGLRE